MRRFGDGRKIGGLWISFGEHTSGHVNTTFVNQGQVWFGFFWKNWETTSMVFKDPFTYVAKFYFSSFSLGEKASSEIPIRF